MKIKIFSDLERIEKEKPSNLNPIIELLQYNNSKINNYYEFCEIEKCDYLLIPRSLELVNNDEINYYIKLSNKFHKKIISFLGGDFGKTIKNDNFIQIRLGGFCSKFNSKTYIMPPFIEDPYCILKKEFKTVKYFNSPTIGFVGQSNPSVFKYLKEFILFIKHNLFCFIGKSNLDYITFFPSSIKRFKYLEILKKSDLLATNFIMRKKYRAGVKNEMEKQKTTIEFYENIYDNLYTFCLRGGGNFSVRFYETLAMGRIPILINTDCKLPFQDVIDWNKHCLIINFIDKKSLINSIVTYHNSLNDIKVQEIQKSNRLLWEKYFIKENFFIQFTKKL